MATAFVKKNHAAMKRLFAHKNVIFPHLSLLHSDPTLMRQVHTTSNSVLTPDNMDASDFLFVCLMSTLPGMFTIIVTYLILIESRESLRIAFLCICARFLLENALCICSFNEICFSGPPSISVNDAILQLYPIDKHKCHKIDPIRDIAFQLYTV